MSSWERTVIDIKIITDRLPEKRRIGMNAKRNG